MTKIFVIPVIIIIILTLGNLSHGRLLTRPEKTAGWDHLTNETLICSSDLGSKAITWYFILFDTTNNVTVAIGAHVAQGFASFLKIVQPNVKASNLIIAVPSNLTAGTYTCSDGKEAASAQYSVMSRNFGGSTNLTNSSKNGDTYYYTCSASFYGNDFIIPRFRLMSSYPAFAYNVTNPEIIKNGSLRYATGTAFKTVTCGLKFPGGRCTTEFGEPRGYVPRGSATNAPTRGWASGFGSSISVACVPSDSDVNICCPSVANVVYYGKIITCSVPSSTPVNYTWTDFTYGNTSQGQQLRIWHNGTYQCNASVELNGTIYSISKTHNNLIVKKNEISLMASPLFGPVAGGTNITFIITHWPDPIMSISAVYIGNILAAVIVISDREANRFVAVSPATTDDLVQQPLQITIEITPEPFNITTDLYFTYRSNSEITNLSPNNFIVTSLSDTKSTNIPV